MPRLPIISSRALARICAIASLALGILVMIGWHLRIPVVIQIHPDFVPMQYNTALGFASAGIGVLAASGSHRRRTVIAGCVAGLIGSLTLVEYLSGVDLSIDQLFMRHYITVSTPQPGRMAPNTALCFTLTGAALLLAGIRSRRAERWVVVSLLSALVIGLGTVALAGYAVGMPTAYGWSSLTRMAAHTSLGFIVLGVGMLALTKQSAAASQEWRPWAVGMGGITITVALWQALKAAVERSEGLADEFVLMFGIGMALALARSVATELEERRALQSAESTLERLGVEMAERKRVEEELQYHRLHLEEIVVERTNQLRSMSMELSKAEERERRAIAQDLHDDLGQILAVAKLKLTSLEVPVEDELAARLIPQFKEIGTLVDRANRSVRSLSMQLSPPALDQFGLVPALEWLSEEMERTYSLKVAIHDDRKPKLLDETLSRALFRTVRELLINVSKHARVVRAEVSVMVEEDRLVVTVSDEGVGFDASQRLMPSTQGGFGLFSISERLRSIGGEMQIDSSLGRGTLVVLTLPLVKQGG